MICVSIHTYLNQYLINKLVLYFFHLFKVRVCSIPPYNFYITDCACSSGQDVKKIVYLAKCYFRVMLVSTLDTISFFDQNSPYCAETTCATDMPRVLEGAVSVTMVILVMERTV